MAFEVTSALIGLTGALVGGAISSVTTILVHRSEGQRFRRERSWTARYEAYTKIIGSLDRARAILDHMDEEYGEDPHTYDASKRCREANAQMIEFFHAARTEFHANRLMLSRAFVAKYNQMNRDLEEAANPNLIPPESTEMSAAVMRRIVPEMHELAVKELEVDQ